MSERIDRLIAGRGVVDDLMAKGNVDASSRTNDFAQALAAARQRHGDSNIFTEYDEAQTEVGYVKKAQTPESDLESVEAQYCTQMQTLYGQDLTRQLCSDSASESEARENEITEWLRGTDEIIQNLDAEKRSQSSPFSNSEIVSHYTNAETAASRADKYRTLSYADANSLVTRLNSDISRAKARRSEILAEYPDLAH